DCCAKPAGKATNAVARYDSTSQRRSFMFVARIYCLLFLSIAPICIAFRSGAQENVYVTVTWIICSGTTFTGEGRTADEKTSELPPSIWHEADGATSLGQGNTKAATCVIRPVPVAVPVPFNRSCCTSSLAAAINETPAVSVSV